MEYQSDNEFDDLNHLLRKIEWPQPSLSLSDSIQAATIERLVVPQQEDSVLWLRRDPLIPFLSILMALFIGLGSGMLSGSRAVAADEPSSGFYGVQTVTIADLYFPTHSKTGR